MTIKIGLLGIALLLGSIPTAYWYGKIFHQTDIRKQGSGNIGATNSLRVLGRKAGIIVLFIDLQKGLLPVLIAQYLYFSSEWILLIGLFAVLGHVFSPFVGFKGGKGIATSLGVMIGFAPLIALICVTVFLLTVFTSRLVSLGSLFGALTFFMAVLFEYQTNLKVIALAGILTILLFVTHRENIKKIMNGTENKIGS